MSKNLTIKAKTLNTAYIPFLLFGMQLVGFVPSFLRTSSQLFLWAGNISILIFSVFIITYSLKLNEGRPRRLSISLFIFLLLYALRMIYDLYVLDIHTDSFPNPNSYLIYFFGICLIPAITISQMTSIDFDIVLTWVYRLLISVVICAILLNLLYGGGSGLGDFNTRSQGSDSMGPLTFGHLGVSLTIISLYRYRRPQGNKLYLIGAVIGVVALILSASRSPLLALMTILFLMYGGRKSWLQIGLLFAALCTFLYLFWDKITMLLGKLDLNIVLRTLEVIQKSRVSGRDLLYEQVWAQIRRSPIFGDSFLVTSGPMIGYYPHNLFLESLLVTGIVGTLFLILWLTRVLRRSLYLIKINDSGQWIAFLFLQFLIFGMFSKSFYTNQFFWYYAFLLLKYYELTFSEKKRIIHF